MHYLYVEPTRALADIVINSGMNNVAFDIVRARIRMMLEEDDCGF
jgi:uridine kinase